MKALLTGNVARGLGLVAVIAILVALAGGGDDSKAPAGSDKAVTAVDNLPREITSCQALDPDLARAVLRDIGGGRKRRLVPGSDGCTYTRQSGRVTATAALYTADEYSDVVDTLPHVAPDTIEGHNAVYDRRLGYLIEMPGRPFYLQVVYFHVVHTHAERSASKRLASAVLSDEPAPPGQFICSLTGDPI